MALVHHRSSRSADNAVRRDEVIKNAEQYVNVLNSRENTVVTHILVSTEAVRDAGDALAEMETAVKVHGTMLIHAAVSSQPGKLHTRSVACFKECCFSGGTFSFGCTGRSGHLLHTDIENQAHTDTEAAHDNHLQELDAENTPSINNLCTMRYEVGQYVAALCEADWYA